MNLYLLFKSLHLIAVISWMAGLLYLPRIFVYHSEANHESQKDVFKTMEKKLLEARSQLEKMEKEKLEKEKAASDAAAAPFSRSDTVRGLPQNVA